MSDAIAVTILAKDARVCQQARGWLESAGDMVVVETTDRRIALEQVRSRRAQVLLADLAILCEDADMRRALADLPELRVIVMHSLGDEPRVLDALRWGVLGHLVKETMRPDEVVAAVRAVYRREAYLSPTVAGWIAERVAARLHDQSRRRGKRGDVQGEEED